MYESDSRAQGFDSDKFSRHSEREKRLKELELSFQNIVSDSKQQQDDIYNAFTEHGQAQMMSNQNDFQEIDLNNTNANATSRDDKGVNAILSNVKTIVTPKRFRNNAKQENFQSSPTGVSSFPDIGPVENPKRETHSRKTNNLSNNFGLLGHGRDKGTKSSFGEILTELYWRLNMDSKLVKYCILGLLLFIILMVFLNFDSFLSSTSSIEVDWDKLREIKSTLVAQNVDVHKLNNHRSAYFNALVWMANEDSETTISGDRTILERFVLVAFFYSTTVYASDEEYWRKSYFWLEEGIPVCQWFGITCSEMDVISEINLMANNLSGTITEELSKLSDLKVLKLYHNNLYGEVPSALGELTNLEFFQVGSNKLRGEMPDSVCSLLSWKLESLASDCGGSGDDIECVCCTECSP
jgi:hypothetical protein